MLVSRILIIVSLLFIFIQDVTGAEEDNLASDNEDYIDASRGSGQIALMSSDSNCGDVYTYHSDCSFHHVLTNVTSNGVINITTHVMLVSVISLVDLENITIIGHDNPTVNCNSTGGIHFVHCHNCTIKGIKWEKCGTLNGSKPAMELYNSSNIIIESCSFYHSITQAIALSEMLGNVTVSGCVFAFNNHFEDHGVAIHYSSKASHHSKFQFKITQCNFTYNGVTSEQSIVYIGPSSNKHMEQILLINSVFLNNQGTSIYISHQKVFVSGDILIKGNVANRGGGILISNYTKMIFHKSNIEFINNEALYGGVLYIVNNSNITFEANSMVIINSNQATVDGGALHIQHNSSVMFKGNSTVNISNNRANDDGGAFFIWINSYVTFKESSTVTISNNQADDAGGAFYIAHISNVIFEGNAPVIINNNRAKLDGGALYILSNSDVTVKENSVVTISNNQANDDGGAFYIQNNSNVTFKGNSTVNNQ